MTTKAAAFKKDSDTVTGKAFDARLVRRMLRYVAPYRWLFIAAVAMMTITVGLDVGVSEVVKLLIDGPLALAIQLGASGAEQVAGDIAMGALLAAASRSYACSMGSTAKSRTNWSYGFPTGVTFTRPFTISSCVAKSRRPLGRGRPFLSAPWDVIQ